MRKPYQSPGRDEKLILLYCPGRGLNSRPPAHRSFKHGQGVPRPQPLGHGGGIPGGVPRMPPHIHGQTGRTLATRMTDHLNLRNPVLNSCGRTLCAQTPQITKDSVRVLDREEMRLKRKVREASEIKIGQAAMNRDQGYKLPDLRLTTVVVIIVKAVP